MRDLQEIPPNPMSGWVPFPDYAEERPQFFPKSGSSYYFLRFRKRDLLEQGVMLRTAAGELVQPAALDDYILELGRRGETYRTQSEVIAE